MHESRRDVNEDAFEPIADGVAVWRVVASHRRDDLWNGVDQISRNDGLVTEEEK